MKPQFSPKRNSNRALCPKCGWSLNEVVYTGGVLNEGQFMASRAGDFYCTRCPGNNRSERNRYAYYWRKEVITERSIRIKRWFAELVNSCLLTLFLLIWAYFAAAGFIWQFNNPKANQVTFFTYFYEVVTLQKLDKFQ